MPSRRKTPLPPRWRHIRTKALQRDGYRCTWILDDGTRCPYHNPNGTGLEVDHIADRNDHRLTNLRTLCGKTTPHNHHGHRTALQAVAAQPRRRRPPEPHPGVLP
jgi:5-methylcytosine-specific restriction protein A